jgi:hypothetical protein
MGGIRGTTRFTLGKDPLLFAKNKFNYLSESLLRLVLVAYELVGVKRSYKTVMISDEFSIIDSHKVLTIDTPAALKLYFDPVPTNFLERTGTPQQKGSQLNKHKVAEEVSTLENYLNKKNKKICNIVYAAYKYSHIIDLYFYNPDNRPKRDQFQDNWRELTEFLKREEAPADHDKTCNYLHPAAKFVLKINFPLRTVRFFIAKDYTRYLSIIATDAELETPNKWSKFTDSAELKEAYIACTHDTKPIT